MLGKNGKKLQITLKLAAYESLGKIKKRNRRKYLKIWDFQTELIREAKKTSYKKWLASKKVEDRTEYQRNTTLAKREVRRRHRASWDKFITNLEHQTCSTEPKVHKILKQTRKNIEETAKIHKNIDENIFLRPYEKLWNTTIINLKNKKNDWNFYNHTDSLVISDELQKASKLNKNSTSPSEDNINSELHKYVPEEFKLRLLKFLNNIYIKKMYSKWKEKYRCNFNI